MTNVNEASVTSEKLGLFGTLLLGCYNVILATALIVILFLLISGGATPPTGEEPGGATTISTTGSALGDLSLDVRLLLIVMTSGALGSYVHSCMSFADYVGNRTLMRSWVWWYLLRTPIGVALSCVFYFLLRGGLLTMSNGGAALNVYGLAGVAALTGMFSKNTVDKLREVFETMFRSGEGKGDAARRDKLRGE